MTQLEKAREEIRSRTRLIDAEFEIFGNNQTEQITCQTCQDRGFITGSRNGLFLGRCPDCEGDTLTLTV